MVPPVYELPVEVGLVGKCIPGWEILQPLFIQIVHDTDDYYNAGDEVFNVYGDGLTRVAALKDYMVALVEFYELVEEGAQSDPGDQVLLSLLQRYLRRVS